MRKNTRIYPELIVRAKSGEESALGALYDAYVTRVYRFVHYRIGHRDDAEDVTQQVFVKLITGIRGYQERGLPFEAWLFRIARNQVIDYYRRKKHTVVPLDTAIEVVDTKPTPDEQLETKLAYEQVMRYLPELTDSYQEIIILKFIEELDNHEISDILNKPVDQVRVLQSRALVRLKKLLRQ